MCSLSLSLHFLCWSTVTWSTGVYLSVYVCVSGLLACFRILIEWMNEWANKRVNICVSSKKRTTCARRTRNGLARVMFHKASLVCVCVLWIMGPFFTTITNACSHLLLFSLLNINMCVCLCLTDCAYCLYCVCACMRAQTRALLDHHHHHWPFGEPNEPNGHWWNWRCKLVVVCAETCVCVCVWSFLLFLGLL